MSRHDELLRSTSRTFAVGIEALPGGLREAVTLAYLVLRVSDYFEDSPSLAPREKADLLGQWADLLSGVSPSRDGRGVGESGFAEGYRPLREAVVPEDRALPDHEAALEGASILEGLAGIPPRFRDPIVRHTAATTTGMAEWATRGDDFPDEAALDAYMFEVAGRVGLLLTDLFEAHAPAVAKRADRLRETAVSFGLGLQTVNVIRGLHEDPARGWTYVPRDLLGEDGAAGRADPRALPEATRIRILDFLVRKAGRHIRDAFDYCLALPRGERGIRMFCAIPALLAAETARGSRGNLEVFRGPVKVERGEVARIVLRARLLYWSNGWLAQERDRAEALSAPGDARPARGRRG